MSLEDYQQHICCPKEWRETRDLTGSFELDAMIERTPNKDMRARLEDHLTRDVAYEKRTSYNNSSLD